jgi:hypothetical protein
VSDDPAEAARRWLAGQHRTWRWNDGSYAGKNRYQAVETTEVGLVYFDFDGERAGLGARAHQSFDAFRSDGPLRPLPADVLAALSAWLGERGR